MPVDYPPQCPDHAHLSVRLEKIKEFYAEAGTLIREDVEYLIDQAGWAIQLDNAGQNLRNAAERYVSELEEENAEQAQTIEELRDNNSDLLSILTELKPKED